MSGHDERILSTFDIWMRKTITLLLEVLEVEQNNIMRVYHRGPGDNTNSVLFFDAIYESHFYKCALGALSVRLEIAG